MTHVTCMNVRMLVTGPATFATCIIHYSAFTGEAVLINLGIVNYCFGG